MPIRQLAAAMALASVACAASATDHPIRIIIAPGRVAEVCMTLAAGDTLRWRFKASTALDFNVHHHVDNEVRMPVDRKAVQVESGELLVDHRNDWCLMWTAATRGKRVTVEGSWSAPTAKP